MRDADAVAVDIPRAGSVLGRRRGSASDAGSTVFLRSLSAAGGEAALAARARTRSPRSTTGRMDHRRAEAPEGGGGEQE